MEGDSNIFNRLKTGFGYNVDGVPMQCCLQSHLGECAVIQREDNAAS